MFVKRNSVKKTAARNQGSFAARTKVRRRCQTEKSMIYGIDADEKKDNAVYAESQIKGSGANEHRLRVSGFLEKKTREKM